MRACRSRAAYARVGRRAGVSAHVPETPALGGDPGVSPGLAHAAEDDEQATGRRWQARPANFVACRALSAGYPGRPAPALCPGARRNSAEEDRRVRRGRLSRRRDDLGFGSTTGHGCERVRWFSGEHATRILHSDTRTDARDWADDHRSPSAVAPMLRDAFAHGLRTTSGAAPPLKGTDATASRHVRGTLGDNCDKTCRFAGVSNGSNLFSPPRIRCVTGSAPGWR